MPEQTSVAPAQSYQLSTTAVTAFFAQVYSWMTAALVVTAAVAWLTAQNTSLLLYIYNNNLIVPILLIELVIVIALSAAATKMHPVVATVLFFVYAVMNGFFFSSIFFAFEASSIFLAFFATAGTFAVMAAYGLLTKSDLTGWGNLAIMGLIGLIIASIINIFVRSDALSVIGTYLGVAIFVVLIAYDNQKLKNLAQAGEMTNTRSQMAILGALTLYLDFINLFIRLLQIFGKRR